MSKNPFAERADELHDQWTAFALLPDARILRWIITAEEWPMLEAFLSRESDDRAGETPDLFLRFSESFVDLTSYGSALLASLERQFDESLPELADDGLDTAWRPPTQPPGTHSLLALLDACTSFQAHYSDLVERLVLVLTPVEVNDYVAWQRWLQAAAERLPEPVRIMVPDSASTPTLGWLAEAEPKLVHSRTADLEMDAAIQEFVRSEGGSGPDGQFRVQFVRFSAALGKGRLTEAEAAARGALAITHEHGWPHLGVAVHLAMGSGLIGAKRTADALERFREAERVSCELEQSSELGGAELGTQLRLQARLGAAAAQLSAGDWPSAGHLYQEAVPLAEAAAAPLMVLECCRMAAYCSEQTGDRENAWHLGLRALAAAAAIEPRQRVNSTLLAAADGLRRLSKDSPAHVEVIDRMVAELLQPTQSAGEEMVPANPGGVP